MRVPLVLIVRPLVEEMVHDHQEFMGHGHGRFLPAKADFEPRKVRPREVGVFRAAQAHCTKTRRRYRFPFRARLERKLNALEREKTRLVDAYQAEIIELAELAERRQRLTEQGQLLRARVQEIEQQRLDRAAELRLLEGVDAFCTSIRDAMVGPSFEVKQKVLQSCTTRRAGSLMKAPRGGQRRGERA